MTLATKLAEERRARLAAERLLEQKQQELHAANRKLGRHARALSEEIVETRAEVQNVRDENQRFKLDLSVANQKVQPEGPAGRAAALAFDPVDPGRLCLFRSGRPDAGRQRCLDVRLRRAG